MYLCVCVCVSVENSLTHAHTCIHTYIYAHACIHTYIHTYIHAVIHTVIYTYIHTGLREICVPLKNYENEIIGALQLHIAQERAFPQQELEDLRKYNYTYIHTYIHTHTHIYMIPIVHCPREGISAAGARRLP